MRPEVSIIPAPDRATEPRRPLTRRETIELAVRQGGRCGCGCGEKLNALTEGVIDEHLISLEAGGTNDLDNRSLFRKPCADAKTKLDKGIIASCKRIEARANGTRRPRKAIPGQKLRSGGFGGGQSKKALRMAQRQQEVTAEHDTLGGYERERVNQAPVPGDEEGEAA